MFSSIRALAVVCLCGAALVSHSHADQFIWTGGAGSTVWADPANWVNVTPGGTAMFPDADDNAAFYANHQVTNGAAANLTNSGTTWIGPGSVTVNGGVILNHGLLTYVGAAGPTDENLVINDSVLLTGAGTLQLVAGGDSLIVAPSADGDFPLGIRDVLTNDVNHTIRGAGEIFIDVVNRGTITADVTSQALKLRSLANNVSFLGSQNRGQISVTNGGIFELANGLLDNRNGIITSESNSTVTVNGELLGGSLIGGDGNPATLLGAGVLNAVSFAGQFQIGSGAQPTLMGTITNQGRIVSSLIISNGMLISDIVTLQGSGVLELNGGIGALGPTNVAPDILINAAGHTIQSGAVSVGSIINLDFINRGKVIVGAKGQVSMTLGNSNSIATPLVNSGQIQVLPNATLQFNARRVDNTGGEINLKDGSTLIFTSGSIFGGTIIAGSGRGAVVAATNALFGDTEFSGNLQFTESSGTYFGTITNNGQVSVNTLGISKTVTLKGDGQLILQSGGRSGGRVGSGGESTTTSPARFINSGNHTIRGYSTFGVPLINEARLQPGLMNISNLSLGPTSSLLIVPTGLTQFGSIRSTSVTSVSSLDGELIVDFQGNYIPGPRTFDILTSAVISGDFASFTVNSPELPWIGPVSYEIIPNATDTLDVVRLTINNGVSGLAGDFNNDGYVDARDYTLWRDNRTAGLTLVANDPTPLTFDAADQAVWATNFGRSWLGAPATPVPEPHAALFLLLAIGALMRGRCCGCG